MPDKSKNIDKLFQQKLNGHKVPAPKDAWVRIKEDMHKPAKTRMLWFTRIAAASVLLFLAFGAGYFLSKINSTSEDQLTEIPVLTNTQTHIPKNTETITQAIPWENEIVATDISNIGSDDFKQDVVQTDLDKNIISETFSDETNLFAENTSDKYVSDVESKVRSTDNNKVEPPIEIPENDQAIAENIPQNTEEIPEEAPTQVEEIPVMDDEMLHLLLISDYEFAEDFPLNPQKDNNSKWSIGGQVSPVYSYRAIDGDTYNTPDESVSVDYFNENEEGLVTVAGGISLNYRFSNKFSLGSGMYLSRIGVQNNDVLAYNDPENRNMYKLATSTGTVTINPKKFEAVIVAHVSTDKDSLPGDYTINGSFSQNLDYLEIPFILKYKVVNNKFSVNLLGGLSPGILVNNRSYFSVEGEKLQTGTVENINPLIYNSVLGIGLEYAISQKLSVNMEPSFKYSLTPVNSNGSLNYHPYSISWFTGISYKIY